MKKTLKLIPAIAMLLISTILVSTATYAWFTMNATVTATGLNVKATADSSLLIKVLAANDSTYSSEANVNASQLKLKPTSTSNLQNFFTASAQNYNANDVKTDSIVKVNTDTINFTASGSESGAFTLTNGLGYIQTTATNVSPITAGTTTGSCFALVAGYNVKKSDGAANEGLHVSAVKIAGNTAGLSDSVRIGVIMVNGDTVGTPVIIAPTRASAATGSEVPYQSTTQVAATDPTKYPTSSSTETVNSVSWTVGAMDTANTKLGTIGSVAVNVYVFVYFEGQDADNHSFNYDNATVDNLQLQVVFGTYT